MQDIERFGALSNIVARSNFSFTSFIYLFIYLFILGLRRVCLRTQQLEIHIPENQKKRLQRDSVSVKTKARLPLVTQGNMPTLSQKNSNRRTELRQNDLNENCLY